MDISDNEEEMIISDEISPLKSDPNNQLNCLLQSDQQEIRTINLNKNILQNKSNKEKTFNKSIANNSRNINEQRSKNDSRLLDFELRNRYRHECKTSVSDDITKLMELLPSSSVGINILKKINEQVQFLERKNEILDESLMDQHKKLEPIFTYSHQFREESIINKMTYLEGSLISQVTINNIILQDMQETNNKNTLLEIELELLKRSRNNNGEPQFCDHTSLKEIQKDVVENCLKSQLDSLKNHYQSQLTQYLSQYIQTKEELAKIKEGFQTSQEEINYLYNKMRSLEVALEHSNLLIANQTETILKMEELLKKS